MTVLTSEAKSGIGTKRPPLVGEVGGKWVRRDLSSQLQLPRCPWVEVEHTGRWYLIFMCAGVINGGEERGEEERDVTSPCSQPASFHHPPSSEGAKDPAQLRVFQSTTLLLPPCLDISPGLRWGGRCNENLSLIMDLRRFARVVRKSWGRYEKMCPSQEKKKTA